MGSVVLQYGHFSSDTARRHWTGHRLGKRWARSWAHRERAERAGGRAWGAQASAAGSWAREPERSELAGVRSRRQQAGGAARGALSTRARGASRRTEASARGSGGLGAGRAAWLRAVHSAYFRSVLTRYCS